MIEKSVSPLSTLTRLCAAAVTTALALLIVGYLPTLKLAGSSAIPGMVIGIGVSLVASIAGAATIAFWRISTPHDRQASMLAAMATRMGVTLVLFAPLALSAWVARKPLALWTGLSYVALLGVETLLVARSISTRPVESR